MNKPFVHSLSRLATALSLLASLAAHAGFYEVEMTIFTHENPRYALEQNWPNTINVDYPEKLASLSHKPATEIYPELIDNRRPAANPWLVPLHDNSARKHDEHVRKLQQSGRRVLFNAIWLQKTEKEDFAKNILIQGGKLESGVFETAGTISLFFGKSADNQIPPLNVKAHLWYVQFGSSNTVWPIPASFSVTDAGISPIPVDKNVNIQRISVLNSTEIITPDTLHYIDHPLFGILIEARPYNAL